MTRRLGWITAFWVALSASSLAAATLILEGAPSDVGYNVGAVATLRGRLKGVSDDVRRFVMFADIQYLGTSAVSSVQLDRLEPSPPGEVHFEGGWPIPADAPTGVYGVTLRVYDRQAQQAVARQKIRGFAVYRKPVQIVRTSLDKTFYSEGETIQCEVVLENLTRREMRDLRLEFSNPNYPWIAPFDSERASALAQNPELGLKVLREHLTLSPSSEVTIRMTPAGRAAFLQGAQKTVMGIGAPARHEEVPPPEVNNYTVAVWNADRTVLYDMQFTPPAILRAPDRDRPIPYGRNFTHPYNSDIDFAKYREFYPPGYLSPAIQLDRTRTMYRPGDALPVQGTLKNAQAAEWKDLSLTAELLDTAGKVVHSTMLGSWPRLASGETQAFDAEAWQLPATMAPGTYGLRLSLDTAEGKHLAEAASDIAVNPLPTSLMIFNAHEDDEGAYGGLIRAAVEAGIPVRVVFFTGGDVGACERYYAKPCGPNEAREFALVRMEESADALRHLGVPRENLTFLGLPDGGLGAIWFEHLKAANPFRSIYLATDHAPFENVFKPNLPFARDAVIEVTKQLIAEFRPAMIATTHPDERHVDHRTANWFVLKACQELLREQRIEGATMVLTDVAYGAGGFKPAPYKYDKAAVYLSGEAAALKQEMGWLYQSQDGNLHEGMRKPLAELPRVEEHLRLVDWQEHAGWNE